MQDTRANMGAHLKWDIPMFLGIASTKDGRARAPIMSSTRRDISLSRLRKAFVSPRNLSSRAPLFFFSSLFFSFLFFPPRFVKIVNPFSTLLHLRSTDL